MRRYHINCNMLGLLFAALTFVACTDEWDNHYSPTTQASQSIWQEIQQNSELSNFARVVQATGYDAALSSSQVFTVFAPTNSAFSSEEADRLVKNAVDTAQRRGDAIVQEAKDEAAHLKQKAESDIAQERQKAYTELVGEISGMAADIAGRMVEREISADDHRELVEEFIRNAGEAS